MKVVIAKVHENIFEGDAESLTAPTADGMITILSKHEPLVTTIVPGTVTVKIANGSRVFPVTDGVLEVSGNQVTLIL